MLYKHILLIDDDCDDQEIFLCALEMVSDAVTCTTLTSAKEALQQLLKGCIEADVIFLDLNMPIMSGQQFLVEFQKEDSLKQIPVFVLSTSSDVATIQHTKALGASEFITKPETLYGLVTVLKSVIH